jgi:O-antigen ligase
MGESRVPGAQAIRGGVKALPLHRPAWLRGDSRVLGIVSRFIAVVALGVVIGMQYMAPDKRMLGVAAAAVIFGVAWRLDMVTGLGVLLMALPYPRGTVFGNTNFALVLLLLLIWLVRVSQRVNPAPRPTPVDGPIAGLVLAYAISFYNVGDAVSLNFALQNTELFLVCLLLFYMLVSNIRTQADLERVQMFQVVSLTTIVLLAIYELNHPGTVLIPGWIDFRGTTGSEFNTRNVRVGGPFFDFELLSEFSAMSAVLVLFLAVRARSTNRRAALSVLLLLDVFVLFATVTRGAIIALSIGVLYLLFRMRRRLRVVPLAVSAAAILSLAFGMNFYVAHFTRSGDVVARLNETSFVGLVPESRVGAWRDGWERFLEHPFIGHGPYYSSLTGTHTWFWPHCLYLYIANLVGLFGLGFFLALLGRMLWISSRSSDDLRDPDYAKAFLLVAHLQLVIFVIDQIKIEYLRNSTYQFEIWVMFAVLVATYRLAHPETARGAGWLAAPAAA